MKQVTIRELYEYYDDNLCKSIKNKRALKQFEMNKIGYLSVALDRLNNPDYKIEKYNIFLIFEPKPRIIMSLNAVDKLVNHYFTTEVLLPSIEPCLDFRNVATRKNKGTSYGIKLVRKYIEYYKKHNNSNFFVLKIDISKFFFNIDHQILKNMLTDILHDDDYKRVCNIIDSTNYDYINDKIKIIKRFDPSLPDYKYGKGLGIGNLSSQCLSIYYLSKLDHFIVHDLHLNHYVRYMDDFLILSSSKEKLENAFTIIKYKLENEYKLKINPKKSFIQKGHTGFTFLGRRFMIDKSTNKTIMILKQDAYKKIKKKIRKSNRLFNDNKIGFNRYLATIANYLYSYDANVSKIRNYITRHY